MAHMIEINDSHNGLLTVTLPMLLSEINKDFSYLSWSLLYLSATGDLGKDRSIVDLEDSISSSPDGFCLEWEELSDIADKFDQVFDTLIVGSTSKGSIQKYENDEDLYLNYSIVLDLFDGAYWRVYSEDESLIKKLADKFSDIKLSR